MNKEPKIIRNFFMSTIVINNEQITTYLNGNGNIPYPTSGEILEHAAKELAKINNIKGNSLITSFTYTSEPYNAN